MTGSVDSERYSHLAKCPDLVTLHLSPSQANKLFVSQKHSLSDPKLFVGARAPCNKGNDFFSDPKLMTRPTGWRLGRESGQFDDATARMLPRALMHFCDIVNGH